MFVAPFISYQNSSVDKPMKMCQQFAELSQDGQEEATDTNWTSSFVEEVLEEEIEMTENTGICLVYPAIDTFVDHEVLSVKQFSPSHLDPPEPTV